VESSMVCKFCNIVAGKYIFDEIDEPFASDESFVAVASIGALVEGWSLIIPRTHVLSMKDIYRSRQFADFVTPISNALYEQYGSLIAFEHGANKEGSITACGINHAHLHIVPFRDSLIQELDSSILEWSQCCISEISSRSVENEYLFYCEITPKFNWHSSRGYLHILRSPSSQFFRRLIARRRGIPEMYDYGRFPELHVAKQTRMAFSGFAI